MAWSQALTPEFAVRLAVVLAVEGPDGKVIAGPEAQPS
jgi:hypothetical protein